MYTILTVGVGSSIVGDTMTLPEVKPYHVCGYWSGVCLDFLVNSPAHISSCCNEPQLDYSLSMLIRPIFHKYTK